MLMTIILFIVILSFLILIHECGHFFMARRVGVEVEEFGMGLPPRIFGKKFGETIYSLNWLPIGGFVKLKGEDLEADEASARALPENERRRYFWARSKKERSMILIAGVFMNVLFALIVTTVLLIYGVYEPSGRVHIASITENSPAAVAGLLKDDVVTRITNGRATYVITKPDELISKTNELKGQIITLTVLRGGNEVDMDIVPRENPPPGEGPLGVAISDLELRYYSWWEAPVASVKINAQRVVYMVNGLAKSLWEFITLQNTAPDIAGPIGIAAVTGEAAKYGLRAVIEFASILSLNLAVLNILPIPALDGGRFLFVFLEKVLGRPVRPAFERKLHQVGMMMLLLLLLMVSIRDVMRLTTGG